MKTKQSDLFDIQEHLKTAPCVPALRQAVEAWRKLFYKGATETTKELLNFWFFNDHKLPDGNQFKYYNAQKEAIETLIYVYEIDKIRTRKDLLMKYGYNAKDLRLPPYDDFGRYCIKMATGSGKTKVMALAMAWQYFNAMRENDKDYAKTFLIIAPNVIVFERLKTDFMGGKIFRTDPLFPKHYELFWDFECYMRGDSEKSHSEGALYLTNIQQFYERVSANSNSEPEEITALLGEKPQTKKMEITDFDVRIANRDGLLMVVNDEAHHTHDEDNEWNNVIRQLHSEKTITAQLDLSATPRYSKGSLFAWTIFDYPLKQAIIDGNVVKRPVKGIAKVQVNKSDKASVKYKGFLVAGVERWKEYTEQLKGLNKKPVLFIMMNDTTDANDVAEWLRKKYSDLLGGDKTLVIHTNKNGDILNQDLDDARALARNVDSDDSKINAIVSVLMLREGWDVKNVTVVVGLRPYTAKANILPEQTIGRGLRLMFRGNINYTERVDIIGNKEFMDFVEDLEKLEDLTLDTFEVGKDKLKIISIKPVDEKLEKDIGIPDLTPALTRKTSLEDEIASIDVMKFKINKLPLTDDELTKTDKFIYEGFDIITKEKLFERVYELITPQTSEEVISYYAKVIAQNVKLPMQFAPLVPKIKEFFERKAFGKVVDLNDKQVIKAMSSNIASYVVIKEFEKVLRAIVIEEKIPELITPNKLLSSTPAFPYSKLYIECSKSVFNYVACDNEFERAFAKFLQLSDDVIKFSKIPEQFGFSIEYTDTIANIRHYYPDFVVELHDDSNWIVETKGREDIDVAMKDNAAKLWCENATQLTGINWNYLKVGQKDFEKLHPVSFSELLYTSDNQLKL